MDKILITGATGFIGFHAVQKFIKQGFKVIGIDDMNDHYDPFIKKKRLEYLKNNFRDSFIFKKIDIRNKKKIEKLLQDNKYKSIINLAARAGVRNSILYPDIYFETNVIGVLNLLEGIKKYQKDTLLIHASTSSVYGDNKVPFQEDDKVDNPLSPYAASKKASEELCYSYHYLFNINTLIFRFFTVYGTYGRPDMCIFRFIKWIDEDKELKLYGNGEQERDFTYVENITDAIYKGIDFNGYDIINLGNDNPIKINTIIKRIEDFFEKKAIIKKLPLHPADIFKTCAKIEKAKNILNWEPKIGIEEGLQIVLKWYLKEKEWVKNVKVE